MEIYAYTMTYNTGFAPCVSNGLMTLACCKTLLRYRIAGKIKDGEKDIYVIGLCGKQLAGRNDIGDEKLYTPVYIAKVSNCIECKEYYAEIDRPDKKYLFENNNWYILSGNPHHDNVKNKQEYPDYREDTDLYYNFRNIQRENYVLTFEDYIYFGKKVQDIKELPKVFEAIKNIRVRSPRSNTIQLDEDNIKEFVSYFNDKKAKIDNDRTLVIDEYFENSCKKGCEGKKSNI